MCPKAEKGASSGHLIASPFVIRILLLVVGKKEGADPAGRGFLLGFHCTVIEMNWQGSISCAMGTIMDKFGTGLLKNW